jgi:3-phenylpropionate/trans-cinnamate dioxygenase ferredoxin reductase subunit
MVQEPVYVIVGANLAGGRAAETLRDEGFAGRVVLIGAEPDRPYERPPLSKEFLRGDLPEEKVYLRPATYYDEQRIELRLGVRALRLRPDEPVVELSDGEALRYDRLLIATGATPRRLRVPGADLPGVHYLRTLRDAREIGDLLRRRPRLVVVGAGFIGAEVAATARTLGCDVTLLELLPVPLGKALGEEVGRVYAALHTSHGVDLRTNEEVAAFRGAGRVEEVVTASGAALPCDLAIVGVGVVPEVGWLDGAGIAVENGVVVDELCATSRPGVYAAGDVANWPHPLFGERLRVEHYDNAQEQGAAAARSMLSRGTPYGPVPFFWSDQYDVTLQYVGHAGPGDQVVFRGDPHADTWVAYYLRHGRLRAALGFNRARDVALARRLIAAQVEVTPQQLRDEQLDLRRLLPRQ